MLTLVITCTGAYNTPSLSSSIVENIQELRMSRQASLAFFYCDFRDDQKKDRRGLLSSLLVQLCNQSNAYCAILSDFYFAHDSGSTYASESELIQCLKSMLNKLQHTSLSMHWTNVQRQLAYHRLVTMSWDSWRSSSHHKLRIFGFV